MKFKILSQALERLETHARALVFKKSKCIRTAHSTGFVGFPRLPQAEETGCSELREEINTERILIVDVYISKGTLFAVYAKVLSSITSPGWSTIDLTWVLKSDGYEFDFMDPKDGAQPSSRSRSDKILRLPLTSHSCLPIKLSEVRIDHVVAAPSKRKIASKDIVVTSTEKDDWVIVDFEEDMPPLSLEWLKKGQGIGLHDSYTRFPVKLGKGRATVAVTEAFKEDYIWDDDTSNDIIDTMRRQMIHTEKAMLKFEEMMSGLETLEEFSNSGGVLPRWKSFPKLMREAREIAVLPGR